MQPTKSPFTPDQEQEAIELFKQGLNATDVMRHFGAKSMQKQPSWEMEQKAIAGTQPKSWFNTQAAGDVFTRAGNDVALAQKQGNPFKTGLTAAVQGGLSPFRALGDGFFGSEVGQEAVTPVIEGMTKFGDVITPEPIKDVVGDVAMQTIEGYESMTPQEQLNQRNKLGIAEVLSYFVGGTAAKDSLVSPTIRGGEKVVQEVARGVDSLSGRAPGATKQTATAGVTGGMPADVSKKVVESFDTAIKPNLISKQTPAKRAAYESSVAETVQSIVDNSDNLRFIDDVTGEAVVGKTPENLKELVDSLEQTKQEIFRQYDQLAKQTGESGVTLDIARLADDLDEVINSQTLRVSSPEAIKYAESMKNRLQEVERLSAFDAQEVIKQFNNSLESFYRNPTPEGLSRQSVDALIANRLRVMLDDEVQAITGGPYQQLKNQYGALSTVERDIMRAFNRDARKNVKGLIDFTDVFSGGQVVAGIISMNPALVGQGVAQKAFAGAIKMMNDPNRKIKKMFDAAKQYKRTPNSGVTPTRKQLPAADPNAPRSEVGSGAAIEVGGQTPDGRVTTGTTERVKPGAVRQPEGTARQTEVERALADDIDAVEQALSEMEADLGGTARVSVGENSVKSPDGGYYRFNELPTWVPDEYRDGDLMARVMRNIVDGKKPRGNASSEIELQKIVEQRIKTRVVEIKKGQGDKGIFSGDKAFSIALIGGGTYFLADDEGMLPVLAIGAMMAVPEARKGALKNAKRMAEKGKKLPETYKRKISEALGDYDAGFFDVKQNGAKISIAPDDVDQRIAELQEKNFSKKLTNKEALEAEELLANKGVFLDPDADFNTSATTKTTDRIAPTKLYHGSKTSLEGDLRPSEVGILGEGFYLTQDEAVARNFAQQVTVPEDQVIDGLQKVADRSIKPVVNEFDTSNINFLELNDADGLIDFLNGRNIKDVRSELIEQGYDGIALTRRGEMVVFPEQMPKLSKTTDLLEEARKYPDAESFIEAQRLNPIEAEEKYGSWENIPDNEILVGYHGTRKDVAKQIEKDGFQKQDKVNNIFGAGNKDYAFFAWSEASARNYADVPEKGIVGEIIPVYVRKGDVLPDQTRLETTMEESLSSGLFSVNFDKIKTRAQLEDIWKQANYPN